MGVLSQLGESFRGQKVVHSKVNERYMKTALPELQKRSAHDTSRFPAGQGTATFLAIAERSHPQMTPNGAGAPLENQVREFMEPRFGHDFSRVRVHTDSAAASSAGLASAQAYTVGNNVVFGSGHYNPGSPSGRQLLAHELAHVVQQDNLSGGAAAADCESEAKTASRRIARGERASVTLAAPKSVQRQPLPGSARQTDVAESASPLLAAAIGSGTLDDFATGKADISEANHAKLARTTDTLITLLQQYPASHIHVIGYTDAVGQESDNQVLGQARADSVQAALLEVGIPGVAVHTESRGASNLVVRSNKSEPRNRRVEVRFEPSVLLRGAMSQRLTLTPPSTQPTQTTAGASKGFPGVGDLCIRNPALCLGKGEGFPGGPPTLPNAVLQPIPDDTPFELMDVQGVAETYTSHGRSPQDLRAVWAMLYWKYRRAGLAKKEAAQAANLELTSTAGKVQSRDYPNAADILENEMQRAYPGATKVGPANVTVFRF
jgi:outer membrane protein OmpA-like peptidoglycan-associated protein